MRETKADLHEMTKAKLLLLILLMEITVQPVSSTETSAFSKGYLVVTFDDGRDGALADAASILQQDGIKATMFVYEESLGQAWQGFLNWEGALKLQDAYGWEFESHSLTHRDMNHLSSGQLADEITMSQSLLQGDGFRPIASFAYPYDSGWDNATVVNLIRHDYVAARRASIFGNVPVTYDRSRQLGPSGCNTCPPDRYRLVGNTVSNGTSVETLASYIDQAITNHTIVILVFHQIVSASPQEYSYVGSNLKSVMDYADQKIQSGVLESLYFSEAIRLLFGISSTGASCWLFCVPIIFGYVLAATVGVVWALLLVRWNRRKRGNLLSRTCPF